jgi:hypothetical protein
VVASFSTVVKMPGPGNASRPDKAVFDSLLGKARLNFPPSIFGGLLMTVGWFSPRFLGAPAGPSWVQAGARWKYNADGFVSRV